MRKKRLWKRQRDILEYLLLEGHMTRKELYEIFWPDVAEVISHSEYTWNNFNRIKVKLCNSLSALKRRNLIVDRGGNLFLTPYGRIYIQNLIRDGIKDKK